MFESPEDRLLIQRCIERQTGAWEAFLQQHLPLLHHIVRKMAHLTGTPAAKEDFEDCLAEVLMIILADNFKVLRDFQGESKLSTYLLVIARRKAGRFWIQRRECLVFRPQRQCEEEGQLYTPETHGELGEEMQKLLSHLTEREREAVRLHHLQGCSYAEVARELDISVNSVGPLLSKARKRLNRATKREI